MTSVFVTAENAYMLSTKAVHQQHMNCLTNNGFLPVKTWLVIACDIAFYAIIVEYRFSGNVMTSITTLRTHKQINVFTVEMRFQSNLNVI